MAYSLTSSEGKIISQAGILIWSHNLAVVEPITGTWKMRGQVMGRDAHHELKAERVHNHMFLRIHESTSTDAPATEHPASRPRA